LDLGGQVAQHLAVLILVFYIFVLRVAVEGIVGAVLSLVLMADRVGEDLILVVQVMFLPFHLLRETQRAVIMVEVEVQANLDTAVVGQVGGLVLVEEVMVVFHV
jgi:hypothetical protein